MKTFVIQVAIFVAIAVTTVGCVYQSGSDVAVGPYFGQDPPGKTPELFAVGHITTPYHEHSSPQYSLDGKEVYWSVFINFWGPQVILYMKQDRGRWTQPAVAPFSGQYSDGNPCFTPDGQGIVFESRRPVREGQEYSGETDLWIVERKGDTWGEPRHLGWDVNSDQWDRGPSISQNGNLYFSSAREGGFGMADIYRARFVDGRYAKPDNLGDAINTDGYEIWPYIAADESFLIFESQRQMWISFRQTDDSWATPVDLSERLFTTRSQDHMATLSNDGKVLFFVSNRWLGNRYFDRKLSLDEIEEKAKDIGNGMGNVFWVDASLIEELKRDQSR